MFTRIANQPNARTTQVSADVPPSCKAGSHISYLLHCYYYYVPVVFICATEACFKLKHGSFSCHSQLRLPCDRCDFSSNQRSINPTSLSGEDEGCGLGEECGPSQKYKPLWCQTKAPVFTEIQPQYSTFIFHSDWVGISRKGEAVKTGKKAVKVTHLLCPTRPSLRAARPRQTANFSPPPSAATQRL